MPRGRTSSEYMGGGIELEDIGPSDSSNSPWGIENRLMIFVFFFFFWNVFYFLIFDRGGEEKNKELTYKRTFFFWGFLDFWRFSDWIGRLVWCRGTFSFLRPPCGFFFSLLLSFSLSIAFHSERFLITYKIAISSCTANSLERKKEREK